MQPPSELKFGQPSITITTDSPKTMPSSSLHSPGGLNLRFTVPKKRYSVHRVDSLQLVRTPVFDKTMKLRKDTPSSPGTVLTVAGLFVVGITLMLSGIIVLCRQSEKSFVIAGFLFLAIGLIMLIICAMLQRKNILKFVLDLNQDLYFLKMSDSYMWKLMFVNRTDLPVPVDHSDDQVFTP